MPERSARPVRVSVALPAALFRDVEQLARRKGRTKSWLFRAALSCYLAERRWHDPRAYGANRVRRLGLTEADVHRAVQDFRRSR
jgi:metal-responsive CopG/Arc/MetJ family transcriptional regulator